MLQPHSDKHLDLGWIAKQLGFRFGKHRLAPRFPCSFCPAWPTAARLYPTLSVSVWAAGLPPPCLTASSQKRTKEAPVFLPFPGSPKSSSVWTLCECFHVLYASSEGVYLHYCSLLQLRKSRFRTRWTECAQVINKNCARAENKSQLSSFFA